jgi:TonB family protein
MRYFLEHRIAAAAFLVAALFIAPNLILGQTSTESTRKIVTRISPQYPSLARSMNLQGSVKADVVVAPNGTVKSVEIKGGHPLLVQAAQNALRGWKWEPAPHETHEVVELKFML